ncbi:probable 6-phosphogluconolactonase 4, chloroplastic [Gastrolobium bilobum]|uniref:probable 6-phosphogluconolactonase 4, chloroplastic n=1 Tax=Gastrolobium bilobum TaxID=150636 RepID=UPI002AB30801|nr:probable 6-phosphogluconolactonase 4, chloroplastic [Gastrolobium bilobum]
MATSTLFSLSSCTPQSKLLSNQKSHTLSPTMSLLSPQVGQKHLNNPLTYNVSPIRMNPKRIHIGGLVKASMNNKNVDVFTKEHLAVSLAKYVADLSNKFIKERGCFTVVLSGGSVKYLRKLVEPPYYNSIDWSKWHIFWVDERVVPKTHVDSNYKLAYDGFISRVPIPPLNVNTIDDALPADGAADVYETTLRRLVASNVIAKSSVTGLPKFDLVMLDMGPDGHVASLFPGHSAVKETKKWVTYLKNAPKPPPERITFTMPVINSSSNIAMVVTGAGKADAVYSALEKAPGDDKLPIQLVSPEGELKWFLDKGAASRLYT